MTVKQVIVMRTDLNMRKGKMIAQGSHASSKVFFDRGTISPLYAWYDAVSSPHYAGGGEQDEQEEILTIRLTPEMKAWIKGNYAKICVRARSEQELLDLHDKAKAAGLPCSLIQDSGKTEFGGVPTFTALAIGPDKAEKIDVITGGLELL